MQIAVPSSQGLDAVAQLTQTKDLHQRLLYIGCMSAAAASANFQQNADTTVPLLEQFALDDYQPEEVKLEVALQLAPLGNCSIAAEWHSVIVLHCGLTPGSTYAAGKLMHKQGLSQQDIRPDLRLDVLLQLLALAVHLLEDDEEKV